MATFIPKKGLTYTTAPSGTRPGTSYNTTTKQTSIIPTGVNYGKGAVASSPVIGGGGAQVPTSNQNVNSVMEQAPGMPSIDFDAIIRPAIEGLDSQIAPLQQSAQADIQGIESSKASKLASTTADFAGQERTIGQAKDNQSTMGEGAASEARRQYSEIQQGLQARYGGTTGTGAFATEQAGSTTLRNIANIRQGVQQAVAGLDEKLVQVKEIGRISLQDIESQATDQIAKSKANLELQLSDIRRQKGELQSRKAELAANAIQMYQNTVNEVNTRNAQFKQQLYAQQQQAEQQLTLAKQRATSLTSSATPTDLSGLIENAQPIINQGFDATISQKIPGGGNVSFTSTKKKDEELANPFQ